MRNGKGKEYYKYNKNIKNNLGITINHYKIFCSKYLITYSNGKVKEFDYDGTLLYEGEYLNGKRNGKGKEYYDGKLFYKGEYLNGLKWNGKIYSTKDNVYSEIKNGKGLIKIYYYDGALLYEGEYLNGKRNGKGKQYYNNGKLFCEGEFVNDKLLNGKIYSGVNNNYSEIINGKGFVKQYSLFEPDVLIYEGECLNGERNGKGKLYKYKGKLIFEGEFINNHRKNGRSYVDGRLEFEGEYLYYKKWNGKGYDEEGNIIYELKNGNGKVREYDGKYLVFEGEYLNGIKLYGKGNEGYKHNYELKQGKEGKVLIKFRRIFPYSATFKGESLDGNLIGNGIIESDIGKYEGEINFKSKERYGILYLKNGDIYEGEFENDKFEGIGILYLKNGDIYEGEFKNDKFEGIGIYYFYNCDKYEGEFKNGRCEGYGIYYFYNGGRYEGVFTNGIYDGFGTFYSTLGFKYSGYFKNSLSTKILIISYEIILFLKQLFFMMTRNKMTLLFIIISILSILINY